MLRRPKGHRDVLVEAGAVSIPHCPDICILSLSMRITLPLYFNATAGFFMCKLDLLLTSASQENKMHQYLINS
ncbi:MAG: hypothetical protein CML22_09780 [Rheinheimera sp.]|nr:hypothetical protein [Rheinheimera sp.]MBM34579.1 hypothetical protein [Rheinheimera sp.]HAW94305.1 hypothetical protein [Candidatus Azambacteria bacterium]|tara:strand:+ start:50582 stop:50800 length:219 start_codon:yes stop_codon:yes gene_type:complete